MQKYQRYRLEKAVQEVTESTKQWLQDEYKTLLESNKPYQSKCDYIGYSINSIDEKIKAIDEEIKMLRTYKQKLKDAKDLAVTVGAEVFESYGISKIEGNGISSITTTTGTKTSKLAITIEDEDQLIEQGYYKKVIDEKKITADYMNGNYKELLESCCTFSIIENITLPKLRINKRKAVNNTNASIDIQDIDEDAA
jgi:hypothetical protein